MNFKEWLQTESGTATRFKGGGEANTDRSSLYGLSARYGHSNTQLPLTWSFDNRAVTSLAAGIGSGIGRSLQNKGLDFEPTPRIEPFPTEQRPKNISGTLPLQLPSIYDNDSGRPLSIFEGSLQKLAFVDLYKRTIQVVSDPKKDHRVIRFDNPYIQGRTFEPLRGNKKDKYARFELSKNFTKNLIRIMVVNELHSQGMGQSLDLSRPEVSLQHVTGMNLTCTFTFKSLKNRAEFLGNQVEDD